MKTADDRNVDLYQETPCTVQYFGKSYVALEDTDDNIDDYDDNDCFIWKHHGRSWLVFVPLGY